MSPVVILNCTSLMCQIKKGILIFGQNLGLLTTGLFYHCRLSADLPPITLCSTVLSTTVEYKSMKMYENVFKLGLIQMKCLSNWWLCCRTRLIKGMENLKVLCQLVIDNCLTTTPVFGQTVNRISTKGADYAHHSTTSHPPTLMFLGFCVPLSDIRSNFVKTQTKQTECQMKA